MQIVAPGGVPRMGRLLATMLFRQAGRAQRVAHGPGERQRASDAGELFAVAECRLRVPEPALFFDVQWRPAIGTPILGGVAGNLVSDERTRNGKEHNLSLVR